MAVFDYVSDIVKRVVSSAVGYLLGKIAKPYASRVSKRIKFMWNCRNLMDDFEKDVEKLRSIELNVQERLELAQKNGDRVLSDVERWIQIAGERLVDGENFVKDFKGKHEAMKKSWLNRLIWWRTLWLYGKLVTEENVLLLQDLEAGTKFHTNLSGPVPPPNIFDVCENNKNLVYVSAHEFAMKEILSAVDEEKNRVIGIHGIGGVGKTTLVMEVGVRVKREFQCVAFTIVTHKADEGKIRDETATARKLLALGKNVLIILDDVWEPLDLNILGIDYMSLNCKILVTTRSEDVCFRMRVDKSICIKPLSKDESMVLFKHIVGDNVDRSERLEHDILSECGGLPLIIQAVGNSLKTRDVSGWKKALCQLRRNAPVYISPSLRRAFTHLKLSYDYLEDCDVQLCFLLCSMFPEDELILLENLAQYLVGLGKFNRLDSIEDARNRVSNAVSILTYSGLLLKVEDKKKTRMHDVVRDVALLIASKGRYNFLVYAGKHLTRWLPRATEVEDCTGISLTRNAISVFPDKKLNFRSLEILTLDENESDLVSSDHLFQGMKNLKVLNLAHNLITSFPSSVKLLTKVRFLNLEGNTSFVDVKVLGVLKDLQILNLNGTDIEEIPEELGELTDLRRLTAVNCIREYSICEGVISRMWRLEELAIEFANNITIDEVKQLRQLTFLAMRVESSEMIPEDFNLQLLHGFVLVIGRRFCCSYEFSTVSVTQAEIVVAESTLTTPLLAWLKTQIEGSRPPHIRLEGVQNMKNIFPYLFEIGFNTLEYIELVLCPVISCLVDTTMEVKTGEKLFTDLKYLGLKCLVDLEDLWRCQDRFISLANLVRLEFLGGNEKLKKLFPLNVAKGLQKLKELIIEGPKGLEEVLWCEGETADTDDNVFELHSLTYISFVDITSLKRFCSGRCTIVYPALVEVSIIQCYEMSLWGLGSHETPKLESFNASPLSNGTETNALNKAVEKLYASDKTYEVSYSYDTSTGSESE